MVRRGGKKMSHSPAFWSQYFNELMTLDCELHDCFFFSFLPHYVGEGRLGLSISLLSGRLLELT